MSLITFDNVSRIYENGDHKQKALDHVKMNLPITVLPRSALYFSFTT